MVVSCGDFHTESRSADVGTVQAQGWLVVERELTTRLSLLVSQARLSQGRRESGLIPIHYWYNLWGFKAGLPKWCYVNAATVHLHCLCAERAVVSIFGSCFGLAAT